MKMEDLMTQAEMTLYRRALIDLTDGESIWDIVYKTGIDPARAEAIKHLAANGPTEAELTTEMARLQREGRP